MKNILKLAFVAFFCLTWEKAFSQSVMEDEVMEENIQTVRIYSKTSDFQSQMESPVIQLHSAETLTLEFDDIAYEPDRYSAAIIHCNADWTPSGLKPADYLAQYNEFNVDDYDYSVNTRIPFIHFTFQIPPVTKSGNYVIKVYRGRQPDEVILVRRFMVFDNQLKLGAAVVPSSKTENRNTSQQINFNINYGDRELMDPINNVKVVTRQNQRWDNAIVGLKPSFIRADRSVLEYQLFDGSNTFSAGNEFRFVDLRYTRTRGQNIASVKIEEDAVFAETTLDQARAGQAYLEYLDLNGQYGIFTHDKSNNELESEYVLITFNLKSEPLSEPPYVLGALSDWGKNPASKMVYDDKMQGYKATLLLKQGWYDYQYGLKTDAAYSTEKIEGEHFQTENEYEIFVYYRDMGSRYDELVGYTVLNPNKRRL
jgi:hypothetical protein